MKIKVKKINPEAVLPNYAHKGDSGMDVYSCEDVIIPSGETRLISTGLAFEVPEGYEIQVRSKSGLSLNYGIIVLNSPGTLDSGYRGELKIILFNTSKKEYNVKKKQKICQIVLAKYEKAEIEEADELSETARGDGGFGSTGL